MLSIILLLTFLANILVAAVPHAGLRDVEIADGKALNPRQILTADPKVYCCTSCTHRYSFNEFNEVFIDFCSWAGNGLELWTSQDYFTGTWYCKDDSSPCIHLIIQYNCGDGSAYPVEYLGCLSYFQYAVWPDHVCGGSPYPGARIESAGGCWMFQATADDSLSAVSRVQLECDESGRFCHMPGSNSSAPVETHDFALVA